MPHPDSGMDPTRPAWTATFFQPVTRKKLIRVAGVMGARSWAEAEDAADAAIEDVARNMWKITGDPMAWARRAVEHHVIKQNTRSGDKRRRALATKGAGTPEKYEEVGFTEIDGEAWVDDVLASLGGNYRQVMRLVLDGETVAEIASRLGLSRTNVRTIISRARAHLRNHAEIELLHRATERPNTSVGQVGRSKRETPHAPRPDLPPFAEE